MDNVQHEEVLNSDGSRSEYRIKAEPIETQALYNSIPDWRDTVEDSEAVEVVDQENCDVLHTTVNSDVEDSQNSNLSAKAKKKMYEETRDEIKKFVRPFVMPYMAQMEVVSQTERSLLWDKIVQEIADAHPELTYPRLRDCVLFAWNYHKCRIMLKVKQGKLEELSEMDQEIYRTITEAKDGTNSGLKKSPQRPLPRDDLGIRNCRARSISMAPEGRDLRARSVSVWRFEDTTEGLRNDPLSNDDKFTINHKVYLVCEFYLKLSPRIRGTQVYEAIQEELDLEYGIHLTIKNIKETVNRCKLRSKKRQREKMPLNYTYQLMLGMIPLNDENPMKREILAKVHEIEAQQGPRPTNRSKRAISVAPTSTTEPTSTPQTKKPAPKRKSSSSTSSSASKNRRQSVSNDALTRLNTAANSGRRNSNDSNTSVNANTPISSMSNGRRMNNSYHDYSANGDNNNVLASETCSNNTNDSDSMGDKKLTKQNISLQDMMSLIKFCRETKQTFRFDANDIVFSDESQIELRFPMDRITNFVQPM